MFFKKHSIAIIIATTALVGFIILSVFTSALLKQAKQDSSLSLLQLRELSDAHAQNLQKKDEADRLKMHEEIMADEATRQECLSHLESSVKSLKSISLPNDLLKNAIWNKDGYATFMYNGAPGTSTIIGLDLGASVGLIEYKGMRVLTSVADYDFISYEPNITHVDTMLNAYYCEIFKGDADYIVDHKLFIPDSKFDNAPTSIYGTTEKQKAKFVTTLMLYVKLSAEDPVVYEKNDIKLYRDISDNSANIGYYIKLQNGRIARYETSLAMFASKITINDSRVSLSNYEPYRTGGCGTKVLNIVNVSMNELAEIGKASNGDAIYTYKDNEKIRGYYDSIYYPDPKTSEKISFEQFLAEQPYFIWFDGFGSAIEYRATKFTPAAECGKPVIYLYPEKDMNVSVKVEPTGGFKFTEPVYGNGWNVWATTQSELTNISDRASYPYLFWEGKAYNYETPDHGFVLKRENVARDTAILLKRLGLNEKESADFMEFWQPKLEAKPFVYVTFVSQEVFDKLAPLTVTPKPDKVIRVFMDYEPLDKLVSVPPLKISTPTRTGFTVVEWGGRLR